MPVWLIVWFVDGCKCTEEVGRFCQCYELLATKRERKTFNFPYIFFVPLLVSLLFSSSSFLDTCCSLLSYCRLALHPELFSYRHSAGPPACECVSVLSCLADSSDRLKWKKRVKRQARRISEIKPLRSEERQVWGAESPVTPEKSTKHTVHADEFLKYPPGFHGLGCSASFPAFGFFHILTLRLQIVKCHGDVIRLKQTKERKLRGGGIFFKWKERIQKSMVWKSVSLQA